MPGSAPSHRDGGERLSAGYSIRWVETDGTGAPDSEDDRMTSDDLQLALSDEERAMFAGEHGPALRLAMRILARMAPLYGARALLSVARAHIDGCIYEGDAGLEFAERLADLGGHVRVPTTLNVISLDRAHWR